MFAHATSSTAPIAPMSTQRALETSPTMSSLSGRTTGMTRQFAIASRVTLDPCAIGHASSQRGAMRCRSAAASIGVTPGLSRASAAMPPTPAMASLAGSSCKATMISSGGDMSRNRKSRGMTPTTCACLPLMSRSRPSAASSLPKRLCANAYERMSGAGPCASGACSCSVNQRPRTGCTPSACSTPCVTLSERTRSVPSVRVSVCPPSPQKPISANVRFSSRYVKYIVGADPRSALLRTVELCLMRTSSSEFGYGSGFKSTE